MEKKVSPTLGCRRRIDFLYFLADQLIAGVVVGPMTVFCWKGLWAFILRHVFPDNKPLCACVGIVVGNVGLTVLALSQTLLKRYVKKDSLLWWTIGYHGYTTVIVVLNVFHWIGLWIILDYYIGVNVVSCWATYAVGQGILLAFRCSKAAGFPPTVITLDLDPDFLSYSTRFQTKPRLSEHHILDVIFTVVVVHQVGIVCYWRGVWNIMDVYLFPESIPNSIVSSLVIVYILLAILCLLQPLFNVLYQLTLRRGDHIFWRWALEATIYFFGNIVNVSLWRGFWMVCDSYIMPDNPDAGYGLQLGVGLGVLWLMLCGQSVAMKGCPLDGEASAEDGCMFPNRYVRHFVGRVETAKKNSENERGIDSTLDRSSSAITRTVNTIAERNDLGGVSSEIVPNMQESTRNSEK